MTASTSAKHVKELTREIERLRRDCYEVYQVVGVALIDPATPHTQDDVARVLDNLVAAANGDPRPHDDLLPWPRVTSANPPSSSADPAADPAS